MGRLCISCSLITGLFIGCWIISLEGFFGPRATLIFTSLLCILNEHFIGWLGSVPEAQTTLIGTDNTSEAARSLMSFIHFILKVCSVLAPPRASTRCMS